MVNDTHTRRRRLRPVWVLGALAVKPGQICPVLRSKSSDEEVHSRDGRFS